MKLPEHLEPYREYIREAKKINEIVDMDKMDFVSPNYATYLESLQEIRVKHEIAMLQRLHDAGRLK